MPVALHRRDDHWLAEFSAMAGPCEVLLDVDDGDVARNLGGIAEEEARRIEAKLSRYRDDNIIHAVNHAGGRPVTVDDETAGMLDFADRCHRLSNGRFDITSGVLRRLWTFDGSGRVPSRGRVKKLLPLIGWEKATWRPPELTLPAGMEIDLGGIGKEYAVDRVAQMLSELTTAAVLVNFGGDLRALGKRRDGKPWQVGVEAVETRKAPSGDPGHAPEKAPRGAPVAAAGPAPRASFHLDLTTGALATSGDARRFLLKKGIRYPHILNPRTGWPVMHAPRSVTVLGDTCTEAGLLATLAMLRGRQARGFLEEQGVRFWVLD